EESCEDDDAEDRQVERSAAGQKVAPQDGPSFRGRERQPHNARDQQGYGRQAHGKEAGQVVERRGFLGRHEGKQRDCPSAREQSRLGLLAHSGERWQAISDSRGSPQLSQRKRKEMTDPAVPKDSAASDDQKILD